MTTRKMNKIMKLMRKASYYCQKLVFLNLKPKIIKYIIQDKSKQIKINRINFIGYYQ